MLTKEQEEAAEKERQETERKRIEAEKVVTAGDRVTLSKQQFDALLADRAKAERLAGELELARADKDKNEARITSLERTNVANKIRSAIHRLQHEHFVVLQLGDYAIDSSDADCLAWLATHPFGVSTVEGLEKLARDEQMTSHLPRLAVNKERGAGTEQVMPVDLTTEAGVAEAVRRGVAQLKRQYSKDELELHCARLRTTPEEIIRKELAADHPEYRKVLLAKA